MRCSSSCLLTCIYSSVQQPANSGALAVLADVAGNAREEMEVATQLKVIAPLQLCCRLLFWNIKISFKPEAIQRYIDT